MGIHVGFLAPSSQVVALALRHAIQPKTFPDDYDLRLEWGTYGIPAYLFTDGGKDFHSDHAQQIAAQLGFTWHFRDRPSEGGIVERPFKTLNQQLWSTLPGYTGSNTQERPEDVEKAACLTLEQVKKLLIQFIVHRYNAAIDARTGDQTRFQRWEGGLLKTPDVLSERELDICLMRQARRQVMRGGYLSFEGLTYKGEHLAAYQGETIALRYDPADITTLYIYRHEAGKEVFLTRAVSVGLEAETLSLKELETTKKKVRSKGKEVSPRLLKETLQQQEAEVAKGSKTMKERRKSAQAQVFLKTVESRTPEKVEDEFLLIQESLPAVEVWDLTQMEEDYGF
jgi:putative transposase